MSEKIKPHHLERKAILYVRQSSSFQVLYNEESRRLQYAMRERLEQLGWEQIEIIDEDLGRSASGMVERSGFQRLVADVCLGKVGAVAWTPFWLIFTCPRNRVNSTSIVHLRTNH